MSIISQILIPLIAFIGTFFGVISGGGAGFIILPLFLFTGLTYPTALATHKLATTALGFGTLLRLRNEKMIDKKLFWLTGLIPAPFVIYGTTLSEKFSLDFIKPLLGVAIIISIFLSIKNKRKQTHYSPKPLYNKDYLFFFFMLCGLGLYNGLLSAGTGVFIVLLYVWFLGYDQLRANALMTSAAAIFWNGSSLVTHFYLNHIIWPIVPTVILSSIFGGYLGISLGIKKGNNFLYYMFLGSAVITALLLLR